MNPSDGKPPLPNKAPDKNCTPYNLFSSTPNGKDWYKDHYWQTTCYRDEEYLVLQDALIDTILSTMKYKDSYHLKVRSSTPKILIQHPNVSYSELQALYTQLQALHYYAIGNVDYPTDHKCDELRNQIISIITKNSCLFHQRCTDIGTRQQDQPDPFKLTHNTIRIIHNQDTDKFSYIRIIHEDILDVFRSTVLYFFVTNRILLVRQMASGYGDKYVSEIYRLDDPNVDIEQIVIAAMKNISDFCKFVNELARENARHNPFDKGYIGRTDYISRLYEQNK